MEAELPTYLGGPAPDIAGDTFPLARKNPKNDTHGATDHLSKVLLASLKLSTSRPRSENVCIAFRCGLSTNSTKTSIRVGDTMTSSCVIANCSLWPPENIHLVKPSVAMKGTTFLFRRQLFAEISSKHSRTPRMIGRQPPPQPILDLRWTSFRRTSTRTSGTDPCREVRDFPCSSLCELCHIERQPT